MNVYTKKSLIRKLKDIRKKGWIKNERDPNDGNLGNLLEDLLGIQENNLPIPNAAKWELKCQRKRTSSLTTLLHCEASPRALKFMPNILLPKYGWKHKKAGQKYPKSEMSFRQTISCIRHSDRGFQFNIDKKQKKIAVSFNSKNVDQRHSLWLRSVKHRVGLENLNPQPYWGFDDIFYKVGAKLNNCFYIEADVKKENQEEFFKYTNISIK